MLELPNVAIYCCSHTDEYHAGTARAWAICLQQCLFGELIIATSDIAPYDLAFERIDPRNVHSYAGGVLVTVGDKRVSSFIPKIEALEYIRPGRDITHLLGIHHDGYIANPDAWSDDFLDWDYIGAAWPDGVVGNNGFCLTSVKFLETLRDLPLPDEIKYGRPSDVVVCRSKFREGQETEVRCIRPELEARGMRYAPKEVADRFSVENEPYTGQFGFHGSVSMLSAIKQGKA